jgi:hypothetical protein
VALLKAQKGVVTRAQLMERCKMTRAAIRWAVQDQRLDEFVGPTFRAHDHAPPTWEQFAIAPTLLPEPGCALSHSTAALLWGVEGFEAREPIHLITTAPTIPALPDRYVVHRTKRTFTTEQRSGLPVTPLARTLLDVSESLDDLHLEIALDSASYRRPFLEQELEEEFERVNLRFTPGASRIRHLLDVRAGLSTESPLETRVRRALRASKLPPPTLQYDVFDDGRYVMRVDFAWPQHKVALHCDGYRWHSRRKQFELDAAQRSQLSALDWASSIVTQRMLETNAWLEQLGRTLERRAPQASLQFAP